MQKRVCLVNIPGAGAAGETLAVRYGVTRNPVVGRVIMSI
jgi:hypothetical protein